MKISNNVTSYEDYKYILQDSGSIYVGAAYTYEDLMNNELTPFKLKTIITHYVLKETAIDTTLESELYHLRQEQFLFELFLQLKIKVKVQLQEEKKSWSGKKSIYYTEKVYSLQELAELNLARKKAVGLIVREIIFPKLALMTFSV